MKEYGTDKIRNIGVVSHARAGKTSLTEALLFCTGAIDKQGKVDDGTTVSDYDDEEIQRKNSINSSLCICEWNGHKINIIDTPGYSDFRGDQEIALRVVDSLLFVIDSVMGAESGTEKLWYRANDYNKPRIIFINKFDKEMAKLDETLASLDSLGDKIVPVNLPIGIGPTFNGIVDLIRMKAFIKADGGKKLQETDIPADMQDQIDTYREKLIDAVAESDDELLEKYLDGQELTSEEIINGFKKGITANNFVPVFFGSATGNLGPQLVLDMIDSLPSPVDLQPIIAKKMDSDEEIKLDADPERPLAAFVFKTVTDPYAGRVNFFRVYSGTLKADSHIYNSTKGRDERIGKVSLVHGKKFTDTEKVVAGDFGSVVKLSETNTNDTLCDLSNKLVLAPIVFPKPIISMAVTPKTQGDDEKLSINMARMSEEDPTFIIKRDTETKETIISGMGELHINVILSKIQKRFNVGAILSQPKIPYRETIRTMSQQQGKYKKQTGGRGQYGDVYLKMDPQERGKGFEFVDAIVGGSVPRQYIPAVEKGLIEAVTEGILSGSPVVDVRLTLYDGSYHDVDSSEMAFKIAASMAFKKCMELSGPFIMEPIMSVEVTIPEEYMGEIMSDFNSRRGRISGMTPEAGRQIIKATVPLAEMYRYSVDLRSITSDRGSFTMEFSHYEEVPPDVSAKINAAYKASSGAADTK
jgi:elongation factor G